MNLVKWDKQYTCAGPVGCPEECPFDDDADDDEPLLPDATCADALPIPDTKPFKICKFINKPQ